MKNDECVHLLQWALPRLGFRWAGFRKVRRQVCRRIDGRIDELGLPNVAAYREWLEEDPAEWAKLDSYCRISISRFYRDHDVCAYLHRHVLPDLAERARREGRTVRVWSAGCASGEEPYSVRILWLLGAKCGDDLPPLEIVATDADEHLLERAREAIYPASSLKELPCAWREEAFECAGEDHRLRPELRDGVELLQQDIRREMPGGLFDLILCRYLVATYFTPPLQREVFERLIQRLRPGGWLILGRKERLPDGVVGLDEEGPPGVYRR